MIICK